MYEKFFQLTKVPFGVTPDPSFLYMTESHREALSGLMYAVLAKKGFVVLTGDAGTGKSTLLRALMRSSKSSRFSLILNPTLNLSDFLELVLLDFGIEDVPASKAKRIMKLQEFFVKLRETGETPALIVDEAHKLSPEILEEIRLLTNFETAERKLLQIILAGQTELRAVLNREDLRQLKQRIEIRLEVKPLSPSDVRLYMMHRWERAGGGPEVPFTPGAMAAIAASSRGIPRLVNCICDNALLTAYGESSRVITGDHIRQVLRDLDLTDYSPPATLRKNGNAAHAPVILEPAKFGLLKSSVPLSGAVTEFPTIERYCPEPSKPGFIRRLAARFNPTLARTVRVSNE